ncbi:MAG: ATP-binding protein [Chloroflexi bacterium]|nr:ATP-binding protein [Chloroflexota bacterium]
MLQKDQWPFIPERLSEIIDNDTLAVIEAGCCERIGRAMTIVDATPRNNEIVRVDAITPRQRFESFCAFLRNEDYFQGGNRACEQCDAKIAKEISAKAAHPLFSTYYCHMGLLDAQYSVEIHEHPVAVLFCGQYRPPHGIGQIQQRVTKLGTGNFAHIIPLQEKFKPELAMLADDLPPLPADFQVRLRREAEHIQRIAEAEYQRIKNGWEQEFLDQLRAARSLQEIGDLQQIQQQTEALLEQVRVFCRCRYVVLYANLQEGDTVLAPVAYAGIPAQMGQQLPHFNWKKAGLPLPNTKTKQWDLTAERAALLKGIRGDNRDYFANAGCIVPAMLGNAYRGILVFGPFAESIQVKQEQSFLRQISRIIGWSTHTDLQILQLHKKRQQWESTAKLLTHQVRTAITPITTQVGIVKALMRKPQTDALTTLIANSLKGAHELCLRLGTTVGDTVKSHVLLLEPEDLKFERYPLSVLVTNCAEGFVPEAVQRQRQIVIEESIERLPQAEIDIARLTIAFSNLIDNAIKYSYPNTKIYIRADIYGEGALNLENALIEIQNDGDQIASDKRERIFEQGERGLTGAKLRRIPGTGLGLWETRAVIEAHGGKIEVSSVPTTYLHRFGQAYRVTFSLKIPLRQTK